MPTTPAIQSILALNMALDDFIVEGLEKRINRYSYLTQKVINNSRKLGFELFIEDSRLRSVAVTAICLPKNISAIELQNYLFDRGFSVWCYEKSAETRDKSLIEISVMGDVTESDINKCFSVIEEFITSK